MNKEEQLQKVIDNMYIAAYYNNDIQTFKMISLPFVSVPVLGRTTKKYIPIESEFYTLTEKELIFKPLKNE